MKVKEESEKLDLKLNIQKTKIMASGPITLWQIDGKQWKQWQTLFWGLQNRFRSWLQPLKRCFLLERNALTNLESILKSREITLLRKVRLVKAMFSPIVMCGCENWTIKKAEHQRIYAFERWCWRRLCRVPWTARRSNESIL